MATTPAQLARATGLGKQCAYRLKVVLGTPLATVTYTFTGTLALFQKLLSLGALKIVNEVGLLTHANPELKPGHHAPNIFPATIAGLVPAFASPVLEELTKFASRPVQSGEHAASDRCEFAAYALASGEQTPAQARRGMELFCFSDRLDSQGRMDKARAAACTPPVLTVAAISDQTDPPTASSRPDPRTATVHIIQPKWQKPGLDCGKCSAGTEGAPNDVPPLMRQLLRHAPDPHEVADPNREPEPHADGDVVLSCQRLAPVPLLQRLGLPASRRRARACELTRTGQRTNRVLQNAFIKQFTTRDGDLRAQAARMQAILRAGSASDDRRWKPAVPTATAFLKGADDYQAKAAEWHLASDVVPLEDQPLVLQAPAEPLLQIEAGAAPELPVIQSRIGSRATKIRVTEKLRLKVVDDLGEACASRISADEVTQLSAEYGEIHFIITGRHLTGDQRTRNAVRGVQALNVAMGVGNVLPERASPEVLTFFQAGPYKAALERRRHGAHQ